MSIREDLDGNELLAADIVRSEDCIMAIESLIATMQMTAESIADGMSVTLDEAMTFDLNVGGQMAMESYYKPNNLDARVMAQENLITWAFSGLFKIISEVFKMIGRMLSWLFGLMTSRKKDAPRGSDVPKKAAPATKKVDDAIKAMDKSVVDAVTLRAKKISYDNNFYITNERQIKILTNVDAGKKIITHLETLLQCKMTTMSVPGMTTHVVDVFKYGEEQANIILDTYSQVIDKVEKANKGNMTAVVTECAKLLVQRSCVKPNPTSKNKFIHAAAKWTDAEFDAIEQWKEKNKEEQLNFKLAVTEISTLSFLTAKPLSIGFGDGDFDKYLEDMHASMVHIETSNDSMIKKLLNDYVTDVESAEKQIEAGTRKFETISQKASALAASIDALAGKAGLANDKGVTEAGVFMHELKAQLSDRVNNEIKELLIMEAKTIHSYFMVIRDYEAISKAIALGRCHATIDAGKQYITELGDDKELIKKVNEIISVSEAGLKELHDIFNGDTVVI